ncbi:DUF5791 family protein [Natronorarus salvus]|uniref:DUF5791 family protein n=1 Tax=Natronorarus salvus TaxID=3117733 RepID=UPI002F263323
MLTDQTVDTEDLTPETLRERYERELAGVIEERGIATASEGTGIEEALLEALVAGESPELGTEEAAAILALSEGEPSAEIIEAEMQDRLLMGMTTAVLDVETLAANLELDLDAKEVQQKVEGRAPTSLAEYAHLRYTIEDRKP